MYNGGVRVQYEKEQRLRLWLTTRSYAERTRDEITRIVKTFLIYCEEKHIDANRLRIAEAEGYREHRALEKKRSVTTVNKELSFLSTYYDYLIFTGSTLSNPFRAVEKMKHRVRLPRGIFTEEEIEILFENIEILSLKDIFFYTCIELLYTTGMRVSELESLERSQVNTVEGFLKLQDTKAKKERIVPLPEYTCDILNEFLLRNKQDKHGFRHTLATHMIKSGADIRQVQEYLGHKRLKTTEVYTRVFPDELLSVIEDNHPREKIYTTNTESEVKNEVNKADRL
jgi:site-specific recombinase XerD